MENRIEGLKKIKSSQHILSSMKLIEEYNKKFPNKFAKLFIDCIEFHFDILIAIE